MRWLFKPRLYNRTGKIGFENKTPNYPWFNNIKRRHYLRKSNCATIFFHVMNSYQNIWRDSGKTVNVFENQWLSLNTKAGDKIDAIKMYPVNPHDWTLIDKKSMNCTNKRKCYGRKKLPNSDIPYLWYGKQYICRQKQNRRRYPRFKQNFRNWRLPDVFPNKNHFRSIQNQIQFRNKLRRFINGRSNFLADIYWPWMERYGHKI